VNLRIEDGVAATGAAGPAIPAGRSSFVEALAAALGGADSTIRQADDAAALVAAGGDDIVGASIARAKADVELEIASVTASRVSGAINSLLQTQV
jgi:flagellar hook-basal body complex protein FliE